jgi:hypothetical protein
MVQTNLEFVIVYDDVLYQPLDHLLSTIPFGMHLGASYNKS